MINALHVAMLKAALDNKDPRPQSPTRRAKVEHKKALKAFKDHRAAVRQTLFNF